MPKLLSTTKTCANCDKTFHPVRDDQKYCGHRCKGAARRKRSGATQTSTPEVGRAAIESPTTDCTSDCPCHTEENYSSKPRVIAWREFDNYAKVAIRYAKEHDLSPELLALAVDAERKMEEAMTLLDQFWNVFIKGGWPTKSA